MNLNFERITPLGDSAIVVEFGKIIDIETHQKVQELGLFLEKNPLPAMIEHVPSFTSVTIFYDCAKAERSQDKKKSLSPYEYMKNQIEKTLSLIEMKSRNRPQIVDIPVCYGGEFGPDLEFVAKINHLLPEEVIEIHTSGNYLTYMIGFAPGFPYLGGLSDRITAPRCETPRLHIPAGTVGIGGKQTGIYPIASPGGWRLIGRTPLHLFNPNQSPPTLIKSGDMIRFRSISYAEYLKLTEVKS
ncbi:5-oxoprolinase subunit PxpB [Cytobacillus sp. Hz8]|uniref:5-oxoprolinase subunit PxpB n=1 Tax=Cytobacillus sp. Hz8 TaxID=3347168 RepID=UPI0035DCDF74